MRQQAAMARRASLQAAAPQPISPPAEDASVYATPHGKGAAVKGFDGYMTPPITPDGTHFDNGTGREYDALPPRCPATPTPQAHSKARYSMTMDYQ